VDAYKLTKIICRQVYILMLGLGLYIITVKDRATVYGILVMKYVNVDPSPPLLGIVTS
jgi:hypothetical protein